MVNGYNAFEWPPVMFALAEALARFIRYIAVLARRMIDSNAVMRKTEGDMLRIEIAIEHHCFLRRHPGQVFSHWQTNGPFGHHSAHQRPDLCDDPQ